MSCPHYVGQQGVCMACQIAGGAAVVSLPAAPDPHQARIADLEEWRPILIKYLEQKFHAEDWHGCQDAASDLRDLDCELSGLQY